jgi:hypothetical protein
MKGAPLFLALAVGASAASLSVRLTGNSTFSLLVNGQPWLSSVDVAFLSGGTTFSLSAGNLYVTGEATFNGTDSLGAFSGVQYTWAAAGLGQNILLTAVRDYTIYGGSSVIVEQAYPIGLANPGPGTVNTLASAFPSIAIPKNSSLGFMTYPIAYPCEETEISCMLVDLWAVGNVGYSDPMYESVPMVWFDNTAAQNTLVASPASSFFTSGFQLDNYTARFNAGFVGSLSYYPAGYRVATIFHLGTQGGVNNAVKEWGTQLLTIYGKSPYPRARDFTINTLTFYTDKCVTEQG